MGQFYTITLYFEKKNKKVKKITFIDSLKIIPFSVNEIAKSFGLTISKLEIDYNKFRKEGHILTKEEKDYIKNDVVIVAKALKTLFDQKLNKMTTGSNALHNFKEIITKERFNHYFPELTPEADADIRKAYKGRLHIY
jgi:transcriptional regulator of met regulon